MGYGPQVLGSVINYGVQLSPPELVLTKLPNKLDQTEVKGLLGRSDQGVLTFRIFKILPVVPHSFCRNYRKAEK